MMSKRKPVSNNFPLPFLLTRRRPYPTPCIADVGIQEALGSVVIPGPQPRACCFGFRVFRVSCLGLAVLGLGLMVLG